MPKRKIINEERALAVVRKHGWALVHVPDNLRTAKVCLEAVKGIIKNVLERIPGVLHDEVLRAL